MVTRCLCVPQTIKKIRLLLSRLALKKVRHRSGLNSLLHAPPPVVDAGSVDDFRRQKFVQQPILSGGGQMVTMLSSLLVGFHAHTKKEIRGRISLRQDFFASGGQFECLKTSPNRTHGPFWAPVGCPYNARHACGEPRRATRLLKRYSGQAGAPLSIAPRASAQDAIRLAGLALLGKGSPFNKTTRDPIVKRGSVMA